MKEPTFPYWNELKNSPLGRIYLACSDAGLARICYFGIGSFNPPPAPYPGHPFLTSAKEQLQAYLAGRLQCFDLPIDWQGMTPFAISVRKVCLQVPYGETITYSQLAELAGFPGRARAAGCVNARNPLPLVIPCHRIIGKDGGLHGYAGPQGIETKRWLLELEAKAFKQPG